MVKLVGLTGGIGAGKSAVAEILRAEGIPVIDADVLARAVVEPGQPAHREIAAAWPEVIGPDGRIDRKRLGAIVFADPDSQRRLEGITHPRIRERIAAEAALLARAGHRLAVLEAALLVETGMYRELAGLVVVVADEETRIGRVMSRDGCAREAVLARMGAQASHGDKLGAADYVVDNSGDLESTRDQALAVVRALIAQPGVAAQDDESARQ
jgi:dephospho-CoA kinase